VLGIVEYLIRWRFLDDLAGIHYGDPLRHVRDHGQVVSD
jgi:hypothetical protein